MSSVPSWPPFTDEEIKAQDRKETCPKSQLLVTKALCGHITTFRLKMSEMDLVILRHWPEIFLNYPSGSTNTLDLSLEILVFPNMTVKLSANPVIQDDCLLPVVSVISCFSHS